MQGGTNPTIRNNDTIYSNSSAPCGAGLPRTRETWSFSNFNPPAPCGAGQQNCTNLFSRIVNSAHSSWFFQLGQDDLRLTHCMNQVNTLFIRPQLWCEAPVEFPIASASHRSDHQHPLCFIARLTTEMLDFCLVMVAQIIKAQAVCLRIHESEQFLLELFALGRINNTFK